MKTRIVPLSIIAAVALSILTAAYAAMGEKKMERHRHHNECVCMMACDPNKKEMCGKMGVSDAMMDKCKMMMHARVETDSPEALLAMKSRLALTEEQVGKLKEIAGKSQKDSEMLLTEAQKDMLKKMAGTPDTMMKMHHELMPMMKKMEKEEEGEEMMMTEPSAKEDMSKAEMTTEQTTCPVTGKPLDKDKRYWTMYEGKKVYFCCPMCKPEFDKNPEKYIDKLPQFKQ